MIVIEPPIVKLYALYHLIKALIALVYGENKWKVLLFVMILHCGSFRGLVSD